MPGQKEQGNTRTSRKLVLSLSFTSLLTFFFLLIAAMTAAYILGVMTGRSQEQPKPAAAAPEISETKPEDGQASILQAHELEFTQELRGERINKKTAVEAPRPEAPGQDTQKEGKEESKQDNAAPSKQPVSDSADLYDYIFQVAALKDEEAADSLRQRLEGAGLRTRLERSGKLLIVVVLMRGDNDRVLELNQIASGLKLGAPLLRSKKPVNQ